RARQRSADRPAGEARDLSQPTRHVHTGQNGRFAMMVHPDTGDPDRLLPAAQCITALFALGATPPATTSAPGPPPGAAPARPEPRLSLAPTSPDPAYLVGPPTAEPERRWCTPSPGSTQHLRPAAAERPGSRSSRRGGGGCQWGVEVGEMGADVGDGEV